MRFLISVSKPAIVIDAGSAQEALRLIGECGSSEAAIQIRYELGGGPIGLDELESFARTETPNCEPSSASPIGRLIADNRPDQDRVNAF